MQGEIDENLPVATSVYSVLDIGLNRLSDARSRIYFPDVARKVILLQDFLLSYGALNGCASTINLALRSSPHVTMLRFIYHLRMFTPRCYHTASQHIKNHSQPLHHNYYACGIIAPLRCCKHAVTQPFYLEFLFNQRSPSSTRVLSQFELSESRNYFIPTAGCHEHLEKADVRMLD